MKPSTAKRKPAIVNGLNKTDRSSDVGYAMRLGAGRLYSITHTRGLQSGLRGWLMDALRLVLILANLVALAFAIYLVNREIDFYGSLKGDLWGWAVVLTTLVLNFVYHISNQFFLSKSRISRLINLWLDAIEKELRRRSKDH